MKPRILALVALAVVLLAACAWWFLQPAPVPAPAKVAVAPARSGLAPEAHYAVDPKSAALHPPAQPAMVVPAPVQRSPQPPGPPAAAPAPPPPGNPQADLKTALPDFVRILKAGDFLTLMKTYMPPSERAQMPPEAEAQMEASMQTEMQRPEMQQMMQGMISAMEYAQTQTPTISADGNTATYSNVPNPDGDAGGPPEDMTWVKENGQWYLGNP